MAYKVHVLIIKTHACVHLCMYIRMPASIDCVLGSLSLFGARSVCLSVCIVDQCPMFCYFFA